MKYDYIVIGAGSAGSVVATRLTEDPNTSVLLLEAGPDFQDLESTPHDVKYGHAADIKPFGVDWEFTGRGTDLGGSMTVPRGKIVGGSSAINGAIFLRGIPEDFDSWAEKGNDQWSYEKVLPYLRKLETDLDFPDDFHGTDGPIIATRPKREDWMPVQSAFYDACRALGYADSPDHNHPDASGVGPIPLNKPDGIRWSTALGYINPTRHRLNLTVRGDCLVRRIVFDGKRATGVEVESGGEVFTVEAEEVILSSGPIGSPHILMLSGVGPAGNLEAHGVPVVHDLPGVGKNLRDHPLVFVMWSTKPGVDFDADAPRYQLCLRYTSEGSHLRNDMQIVMISFATERDGDPMTPMGVSMLPVLNLEVGEGELTLQSSDPNVQPFLDYNYMQDEFDLKRVRDGIRLCINIAGQDAFRDIIDARLYPEDDALESDDALNDWILRNVKTCQHISGTCKMGPETDPLAVVDQEGRVYGLEGLRVADLSVASDCVRANTNNTAIMIGERMADFIRSGG